MLDSFHLIGYCHIMLYMVVPGPRRQDFEWGVRQSAKGTMVRAPKARATKGVRGHTCPPWKLCIRLSETAFRAF